MPNSIASADDVALLLGDDNIDPERAEALLETAIINCSLFVSPVPAEAKGIVVAIAARAYSNSIGVQAETVGPYTATYGTGFIGLLPTTREEKLLKRMAGQGGAFSIETLPSGTNAVQLITVSGSPTGGHFTLTLIGQTTAALPYNASSAQVLTALTALSQIGAGNVSVTGEGPYTVTFINNLKTTPVPTMTADSTGLTPSGLVIVATVTAGVFAPGENLPPWDRDYFAVEQYLPHRRSRLRLMGRPLGQTVTVLRRAAPIFPTMGDYPTPDISTDVNGCAIWPSTTTETVNGEDTVVWGLTVLLPVGTDILATDQVAFHGVTYEVNGQPFTWHSPMTGKEPGIEVQLRAATG